MTTTAASATTRGAALAAPALAACAGAVNLLAFAGLGGAFAGIVTGNLVIAGLGVGTADLGRIGAVTEAVAGFAAGLFAWSRLWRRRPDAVLGPLVAELAVLAALAAGWFAAAGRPGPVLGPFLLVLASMAMGGQSVIALRLHAATTYMTGALTGALHDLAAGRPGGRVAALGQIGALVAGAIVAAALLSAARPAAALLPIGLVAVAIGVRLPADRGGGAKRGEK
ncbi:DUF1275 family protein [Actinomadura sp. NPDC047616]|uniref:DUF1275 family protein n=1 Tax=Actinomadura sp. NPDC047616 TaxID=3155914 RepID=UPI0033D734EC